MKLVAIDHQQVQTKIIT